MICPDPPAARPAGAPCCSRSLPALAGPLLVALVADQPACRLAYAAGVALAIVGLALTARWVLLRLGLRGPERVVFTLAGWR